MRLKTMLLVLAATMPLAMPVIGPVSVAAQGVIEGSNGQDFEHERTGAEFPTEFAGLPRVRMVDYGAQQFDVSAQYEDSRRDTVLTVYIYRAGLRDASIAFDILLPLMASNEATFAETPSKLPVTIFAPPHSDSESGIRVSYAPEGATANTSNAAMIFPYGDWLVKMRFTSNEMNPQEADDVMDAMLAELNLPDPHVDAPPAQRIRFCEDEMDLRAGSLAENSLDEAVGPTVLSILLSASVPAADQPGIEGGEAIAAINWCKQDTDVGGFGIYRPNARDDAYVLALNDAGVAITAGHWDNTMGAIASEIELRFPVVEVNSDGTRIRALYDAVPTPEQLVEAMQRGASLGFTDRDGAIEIGTGVFGED